MSQVPFVEPFAVVDTVISDLGRMDHIGDGIMRVTLVVNQADSCSNDPGAFERVVIAKLVGSDKAMKRLAFAILAKLAMGHSDVTDEQTIAARLNGVTVQ